MSDIVVNVEAITKDYRVPKRQPGFRQALKALLKPEFECKRAMESVSFSVKRGEILGYIGPNGAGKSTTVKILAGVLLPTSGRCTVLGRDPFRFRRLNAQKIGVVFGQRTQLWWNLPALESLELMRYVYKIPAPRFRKNLAFLKNLLDLSRFIDSPVRSLSLGERMRVEFCAALLHEPELLFLDEPTIGLDVVAKNRIRDLIKAVVAERKVTVMLTTHDLGDIEKLSTRVIILDKGRLVYDGTLPALTKLHGTVEILTLTTEDDMEPEIFHGVESVRMHRMDSCHYEIHYDRAAITPLTIMQRINERTRVTDFTLKVADLEEFICKLYESGNYVLSPRDTRPAQ